jgi:tRNA G26 N,N-dimethylase Trm1
MARTEFTPLIDKLNETVKMFTDLFESLLRKAEKEKAELKNLYARMKETSDDIYMMTDIGGEVGNIFFGIADAADHVSETITDVIAGGESKVPDCSYEEFMHFCDECGTSIKVMEPVYLSSDNDQWLCEKCHEEAEAREETCECPQYEAEPAAYKKACECTCCKDDPAISTAAEICSEN